MPPPIIMPYSNFVREHKHLIKLLDASKSRSLKSEAAKQKTELNRYMKKRKH